MERKRILILGIGNILLRDEGIGVRVAERMQQMALPPDVEVMDGGTMGIDLLYAIEGRKKVVAIDAVAGGLKPGTLYRFTGDDLAGKKGLLRDAHGFDFGDVIRTAKNFSEDKPGEIIFIGVEPEIIDAGMELSPSVEEKIPKIIELVLGEIGK